MRLKYFHDKSHFMIIYVCCTSGSKGIGGELLSFMKKCVDKRLTPSESIKAGRTAVANDELSERAIIFLDDYNAIRNCMKSFNSQLYESMESHANLIRFHRKHSLNRCNNFMEMVEKYPNSIVSLMTPAETVSSTGNASSCFIISSPSVLHSFVKLHEALRGYKWHCKFYRINTSCTLLRKIDYICSFKESFFRRFSQIRWQSHQHQELDTVHSMYVLSGF